MIYVLVYLCFGLLACLICSVGAAIVFAFDKKPKSESPWGMIFVAVVLWPAFVLWYCHMALSKGE
ncbi:MAG: hypothetical protein GY722_18925 [bacterium]|nr:hypothetical protein [bacterium]